MYPPIYHMIFESLSYFVGFRLFLLLRKKHDPIETSQRNWVIAGGILGAALGSKLVVWLDDPALFMQNLSDIQMLVAGKGIVGALTGGWLGVEITKKLIGLRQATGDLFVMPLIIGMIIGRIGCFVTGFYDHTYGTPTSLPWGFDFGDGISRHPAQLYEIVFLATLLVFIRARAKCGYAQGEIFRFFMIGYLFFRFMVEFIKPTSHIYWGLDSVQVIALICFWVCRRSILPMFTFSTAIKEAA
jgi:prolipoprotein diacylglyceryltransferase